MIFKPTPRTRRIHWALPLLVFLSLLLVLPTWAEKGKGNSSATDETTRQQQLDAMRALQEEQIELQHQMHQLQLRHDELQVEFEANEIAYQLDHLRAEQANLASRGEREQAEMLAREIALLAHESESHQKIRALEMSHERRTGEMADQLQRLALDLERAHVAEDEKLIRELALKLLVSEIELDRQSLDEFKIREIQQQAELQQMKMRHEAEAAQLELERALLRQRQLDREAVNNEHERSR